MQTIPVIYSRSFNIGSYIIRLADRQGGQMCPFSHVGIISECGKFVYESIYGAGVVKTPIDDFYAKASAVERGEFPCLHRESAYKRIHEEMGKEYDLFGAVSLGIPIIGRDWEAPNKWWCSELLAHASGIFERNNVRTIGVSFCHALTRYG